MMRAHAHRGSVLLEIVISVSLFVAAGMTIFGSVRQSLRSAEGAHVRSQAVDLASSAMALLEAGLATPDMLNGPALRAMDHVENASALGGPWSDQPMIDEESSTESRADADPIDWDAPGSLPSVEERLAETPWELEVETERSAFAGLHRVMVRAVKYATRDRDAVVASYELTQLVRLSPDAQDVVGENGLNELVDPASTSGGER